MPQSILLIESDLANAGKVREALITGDAPFHVESARLCSEALEKLADQAAKRTADIAAVLVNLFLPDSTGIETFDRLFEGAPQIPILVICNTEHEDLGKLAVQRGAQDYLLKSRLDAYLLPKTLRSMIERAANAEALFDEKERAQVTLNSIGDAVMSSDVNGNVTYLNVVAETLTGWSRDEAAGHPVQEVFNIVDATTRDVAANPMTAAIQENKTVLLAPNCILIRRDGVEAAIEDSAAPIHDRRGRVTGAVMVFHDVSATRALSIRMLYLAQHDNLTDLPNRAVLNDRLQQAVALARRHGEYLSVLFLDIDNFKNINDTLGHAIGDRLLREVAQRLVASVRQSDTVSRLGGDEFVILLSEVSSSQGAAVCADKIRLALSAPFEIDHHRLHITASIGIVSYPDDGLDADTLMKHADLAMYHAKDTGRDNYQFFKSNLNVSAHERHFLENGLREAMDHHRFVLHYQSVIDLRTEKISGVEALIRWCHPKRGLVSPAQFVPVAEESRFIVTIGRWVLREACRQARAWQDAHLPPVRMGVNVSAVELCDKYFVAGVRDILAETGLAPEFLELELTETFLMQDVKSTAAVLCALKDVGVQIALDDFGTGYSSLTHLKRFPIDTLKIDQAFVRDLSSNSGDAVIVDTVIGMGKKLHMRVVAEGVETKPQLASLQELSCPLGQGYYFDMPANEGEFTETFTRRALQSHPSPDWPSPKVLSEA